MLNNRITTPPSSGNLNPADTIPEVVPPLPRENLHGRNLPWQTAFDWLRAGWSDTWNNPMPSIFYGLAVFAVSVFVVWLLFAFELDYALFPALAGFMVVGPLIANGLYEKSRRLENGQQTSFSAMVFVKPGSSYQALFMGVLLLCLFLLWMRAAVIIWALFFGISAFPGTGEIIPLLLTTQTGWALLLVGGTVGALFAAFAFAISVFAVPMLLAEETDALSALGISMAMVWGNLPVMLAWGVLVLGLFILSAATAFVGLIIIFPVLGHATWHVYRAMRSEDRQNGTPQ